MYMHRSFLFLSKEGDKTKLDLNHAAAEARWAGDVWTDIDMYCHTAQHNTLFFFGHVTNNYFNHQH